MIPVKVAWDGIAWSGVKIPWLELQTPENHKKPSNGILKSFSGSPL